MDRLYGTWSKSQFKDQRLAMIWDVMRHYPYDVMIKLVDGFINSSKTPPMPQSFREALASEMRSRPATKTLGIEKVDCNHCDDLGVCLLLFDTAELLCLCDCKSGKGQSWKLPCWRYSFAKYFARAKCRIEWFKPEPQTFVVGEANQEKQIMRSINRKVGEWQAKVHLSEDFWIHAKRERNEIGKLIDEKGADE